MIYGVSTGDGNNGVSHMFADYYVRTDDPYTLATAAAYDCWKPVAWDFLDEELQVDGEPEYTISAWLYEEPGFEPEKVTCEDCGGTGYEGEEDCETCEGDGEVEDEYYESGPAAFILEVFPAEEADTRDRPIYDSIEDALSEAAIDRARRHA